MINSIFCVFMVVAIHEHRHVCLYAKTLDFNNKTLRWVWRKQQLYIYIYVSDIWMGYVTSPFWWRVRSVELDLVTWRTAHSLVKFQFFPYLCCWKKVRMIHGGQLPGCPVLTVVAWSKVGQLILGGWSCIPMYTVHSNVSLQEIPWIWE